MKLLEAAFGEAQVDEESARRLNNDPSDELQESVVRLIIEMSKNLPVHR